MLSVLFCFVMYLLIFCFVAGQPGLNLVVARDTIANVNNTRSDALMLALSCSFIVVVCACVIVLCCAGFTRLRSAKASQTNFAFRVRRCTLAIRCLQHDNSFCAGHSGLYLQMWADTSSFPLPDGVQSLSYLAAAAPGRDHGFGASGAFLVRKVGVAVSIS